eukprot:TRINITY_DN8292_c0_g2_i1.p1 TRINITY_DN8292_c0_g2~~TRINITY_DN8292_c0_g2_i1.p1  ORF type:complete len:234 (-),score=61.29 TRINITY_DN8292_c0_g2_i1:123-824(-)
MVVFQHHCSSLPLLLLFALIYTCSARIRPGCPPPPFFSVNDRDVYICYIELPPPVPDASGRDSTWGVMDANVRFADGYTFNWHPRDWELDEDGCISFEYPQRHGFPEWVQVNGFDCHYGENNEGRAQNCGAHLCDRFTTTTSSTLTTAEAAVSTTAAAETIRATTSSFSTTAENTVVASSSSTSSSAASSSTSSSSTTGFVIPPPIVEDPPSIIAPWDSVAPPPPPDAVLCGN